MKGKRVTSDAGDAQPIDWGEVHRRMEAVQEALDRGSTHTSEEKKAILRARARALAREVEGANNYSPVLTEAAQGDLEIVEFLLAHERYGIESSSVREVYPLRELTPLPGTPPFVLGIINVRGQILSVIDLKKFFGLPEKGLTDLNQVIILQDDQMEYGILADAILGVRSVALAEIQPSLPTLTGIREEVLKGVTGERVVILDGPKLLSDPRMIVHEE